MKVFGQLQSTNPEIQKRLERLKECDLNDQELIVLNQAVRKVTANGI
jgi:hypothetical protein